MEAGKHAYSEKPLVLTLEQGTTLRDLAKAKGLDGVSPAMMEGYAAAKVLTEGLRRAGANPTPVTLRDALENLRSYDLGGLTVAYSPTNHTGLDFADLSIVDASGKFRR